MVNSGSVDSFSWLLCQPIRCLAAKVTAFMLVVDSGDKVKEVRQNKMGWQC